MQFLDIYLNHFIIIYFLILQFIIDSNLKFIIITDHKFFNKGFFYLFNHFKNYLIFYKENKKY